jgi:hypothetical protein
VLTAAAAACLVIALAIDVSRGGHVTMASAAFALAGMALIALSAAFPRPRLTRRQSVSETPQQHPAVAHPVHLRRKLHRAGMGRLAKANDWAATHLAVVFGISWTIWVFFAWPLLAQFFSPVVQVKTSYYAQSWIQLFALPLMVYVGNKLQRSSDAQSEVIHQALTHIATVSDQNKQLLEQNTELTTQVHALVSALPKPKTLVRKPAKGDGA